MAAARQATHSSHSMHAHIHTRIHAIIDTHTQSVATQHRFVNFRLVIKLMREKMDFGIVPQFGWSSYILFMCQGFLGY